MKRLSHSLSKLLEEVDTLFPGLALARFAPLVEKFGRHYAIRYPDNPDASKSMTTADRLELDELVIFLNENLPCPQNVKYRTGLYALITFSLGPQRTVTPLELWIKSDNRLLLPLLPRINSDQAEVIAELYPGTPK